MSKRVGLVAIVMVIAAAAAGCECGPAPVPDGDCPDGRICFADGGTDGAIRMDGMIDPNACYSPPLAGRMGGSCIEGTRCAPGLACGQEFVRGSMGPLTLGTLGILAGDPDPDHDGEFIAAGNSTVPIYFGTTDGVCSTACDPAATTDGCGMCASCSETLGGAPALGQVGFDIGTFLFDADPPGLSTSTATPGICRANCTPGGQTCQAGATCDWGENICVEGCQTDAQCNLEWGVSEAEGLVSVSTEGAPYRCDATTRACVWDPPAGAANGSACETNADCPSPNGFCAVGGRCLTQGCNIPNAAGDPMYPCGDNSLCVTFSGTHEFPPSICIATCTTQDECFSGQSCRTDLLTGNTQGICWFNCENDGQCATDERCQKGIFTDPDIGRCTATCDPAAGTTGCETDEFCTQVDGQTYGFCDTLDSLCFNNNACAGGQACRIEDDNFYGRCVDGCGADTDCNTVGGEECAFSVRCTATCGPHPCSADVDCGTDATGAVVAGSCNRTTGVCTGGRIEDEDRCGLDVSDEPNLCDNATRRCVGNLDDNCADGDGTAGVCDTGLGFCQERRGVCRSPDGACSPSPVSRTTGLVLQPGRGDAQCVPTQRCGNGSLAPDALGTCQDPIVVIPDGGVPMDAGIMSDAGVDSGVDAGVDSGP